MQVRVESLGDTPLLDLPFAATHAQYARAQAATGVQSFDDQIYFAVADMLGDPAHRAFIQARFDHVLVDEFQDLNGAQLALVDVLSRPYRRLFVVGDDDQLIYGWRQADPRGILEFHERMPPRPFSATYTLCTNYRCSRAVVETGARLVANNVVREAKDIRPRAGAQDGEVRFFGAPSWPERAAEMCSFLRSGEGSARLRLARPRRALPVPLTATARRTRTRRRRRAAHAGARLHVVHAPGGDAPARIPGPGAYTGRPVRPRARRPAQPAQPLRERPDDRGDRRGDASVDPRQGDRGRGASGRAAPPVLPGRAGRDPETPARAGVSRPRTSEDLVWTVVETFGLDGLWAAEADAAAAGDAGAGSGSDGAGPLQVLDSLLLLAETYPDPATYLRTWDRLRADEEAHTGAADDTLAT